jgi:hypothetical protein
MERLFLTIVFYQVKIMKEEFSLLPIDHIYSEKNVGVDSLSKEGLTMNKGSWSILKLKDGMLWYKHTFHI